MSSASSVPVPAQIEYIQGVPVVAVLGRLDTITAAAFDAQVAAVLAQPCSRILLDMSAATYVSSMGLRSIFKLIRHAKVSGGKAGLFAAPAMIMELLEMSGFPVLIDIYPDRESALQSSGA